MPSQTIFFSTERCLMKSLQFVSALCCSLSAFAGQTVKTAGQSEATAEGTTNAIKKYFQETMPEEKGDAFVEGALNINKGAKEYNQYCTNRLKDDFDQPDEYSK